MNPSQQDKNKQLVLEAFDTLFNRRDFPKAEKFWSPGYIQHSARVPPGREGLFGLVRGRARTGYENHLIFAEGDYVMAHGRFLAERGQDPNLVAADILRIENGVLAEHWDVLQFEATRKESKSGLPMFGRTFPGER